MHDKIVQEDGEEKKAIQIAEEKESEPSKEDRRFGSTKWNCSEQFEGFFNIQLFCKLYLSIYNDMNPINNS